MHVNMNNGLMASLLIKRMIANVQNGLKDGMIFLTLKQNI